MRTRSVEVSEFPDWTRLFPECIVKVKVIRSRRRKKTIEARLDGDVLEVRAPYHVSSEELEEAIAKL